MTKQRSIYFKEDPYNISTCAGPEYSLLEIVTASTGRIFSPLSEVLIAIGPLISQRGEGKSKRTFLGSIRVYFRTEGSNEYRSLDSSQIPLLLRSAF